MMTFALMLTISFGGLPEAKPEQVGFDPNRLAWIDWAIGKAIDEKKVAPGAVVLVARHGKIAHVQSFGLRAIEGMNRAMLRSTIFDLASLTKPVATATLIMKSVELGRLRLDDPIRKHMPEFDNHGKGSITVEQLLRHRSGLMADNPIDDYAGGEERAWQRIANLDLVARPGEKFLYSDVGYLILGRLAERVSPGQSLSWMARQEIFQPLGMKDTGFTPVGRRPVPDSELFLLRFAPTEKENGHWLLGVVHDPRARALDGVAGHAGLFGTADDLAVFAQMLLDGGKGLDGSRILSPLSVRKMIDPGETPPGERRGLGWDIDTTYSAPRGQLFGPRSFGHTGFTGTSLWIDPETETIVVLLTSRLHPDGKSPSPSALRAEVATLVASAIVDAPIVIDKPEIKPKPSPSEGGIHPVDCGIDVLVKRGFEGLKGKRVGLVTNHTGRTRDGRSTIDVLFRAPDVKLVALFSPEHGIRGLVDKEVPDSRDEATGLTIVSLYEKGKRKPSPESLKDVDVLVYDIQDIGTRFYTYISTLGLVLEAAKDRGIPSMVLDRPNPIGGSAASGPVRDPGFESFIAHHALPVRHGMTVGELARLFNSERSIGAELTVIPCEGWRRDDFFDRTGLAWVNPSPNMRSPVEAILYPGVGLLEATNLATGRGTDTPFERVGAPWIDAIAWSKALNESGLPGVRFAPIRFAPKEREYAGKECQGVYIAVTDRAVFEPVDLGIAMASTLRRLYPQDWKPDGFLKMLADEASYRAIIEDGKTFVDVREIWKTELDEFKRIRQKYLLEYP